MKIAVKVKQAGRRHALLENRQIEIDEIGQNPILRGLINAVVKQQVAEFNRKPNEKNLLPFLSKGEIERNAENGKVGFGSIYNENKADLANAQETALQAFADGIFAVFAGDDEIQKLDEIVRLNDETVITFIRLTFLAGSFW